VYIVSSERSVTQGRGDVALGARRSDKKDFGHRGGRWCVGVGKGSEVARTVDTESATKE